MSALGDAIQIQQRALGDLRRSRESSVAWHDQQRENLNRQVLDPVEADAKRLLEALRKAGSELDGALSLLPR